MGGYHSWRPTNQKQARIGVISQCLTSEDVVMKEGDRIKLKTSG